jgi:Mycothiol maleylpyruvate isomerase N-terminal domain
MSTLLVVQDRGVRPKGARQTSRNRRAYALAERVQDGARTLAAFVGVLAQAQWKTRVPKDGRTIGVIVHHVASIYPLEIEAAQSLAAGQPVTGVTLEHVKGRNATHAEMYADVTKEAALDLLWRNSEAAATAIRAMSDEHLDRAAPMSLYANAAVTCQFLLEDRVVRHSYHHLDRIQKALKAHDDALARLKQRLTARLEDDQHSAA